jgi:NDP-4-keto-2,6-dideoxyhexose 3-C-methyltransferase
MVLTQVRETITRTTCRVCQSDRLSFLFSLGSQYINDFISPDERKESIQAPLELMFCEKCTLVQLRHTAPQELLYRRYYWYKSGVTDTMRSALRDITVAIESRVGLSPDDVVLDIGSNDGTLLRSYTTPNLFRVGVEPASNLADEGKQGLSCFIPDFWSIQNYRKFVSKKAKVITAIGMFYDMEDPNQFISDSAEALQDDGIFVAQMMCLKNMLDQNDVGNICHEHLEYYSFSSLEYLFENNGLKIVDVELNSVNGGSYRVYARKKNSMSCSTETSISTRVKDVREGEAYLRDKSVYSDFLTRLESNKASCVEFIKREVSLGKSVWVYGASTKGNVILQYFGLDSTLIDGASERSPWKWGKYTVGTMILCKSEEEARKSNPDYFLVLPYAFIDEFYKREEQWRKGGGKFIVPFPEFRVLD